MSPSELEWEELTAARFEKRGVLLDVGDDAAPDSTGADGVVVAPYDEGYRLWYTATSPRGVGIYTAHGAAPDVWLPDRADVFAETGTPESVRLPDRPWWHPAGWLSRSPVLRDPYARHHQRLWYLWYTLAETPQPGPRDRSEIWGCTCADAHRWLAHQPALTPGTAFDQVAVADAAVVREDMVNMWVMAYAGSDGDTWRIGLAESVDLLRWSPIGMVMETWWPTVTHCRTPRLLRWGSRWLMVFAALVEERWGVYGSVSDDTIWWTTPMALVEPTLPTDAEGQRAPFPLQVGNDLYLYYGGLGDGHWRTHLAVARGVLADR